MFVVVEEVEDNVERSAVEVVKWNHCLYLRHFRRMGTRPLNIVMDGDSLMADLLLEEYCLDVVVRLP